MAKMHPLDGQHIVYYYGTQDCEDEGWALALYKLDGGRMREIYHPVNHVLQPSGIGERNVDELIELMKRKRIEKVYSVRHLNDFFGIPAEWISLHEPGEEPEEVELWAEWKQVEEGGEEHQKLQENGIEVIFYEEPVKKKARRRG